jgi:quercetin dioxygenase-like cupin family protein
MTPRRFPPPWTIEEANEACFIVRDTKRTGARLAADCSQYCEATGTFPPSARRAVLVGEPTQAGPYLIRVKVPSGVKLMPHRHPEDRIYTVMSGVFYIGLGDQFDGDKVKAYPPGSVIVLPSNTWHFHWAKSGEYVTQVTAIGPLGLEYVNAKDDPRNRSS